MIAILGLLIGGEKAGALETFRGLAMFLFLLLPVLAVCQFAGFAYDIVKRRNPILSRPFIPRLVTHIVGCAIGVWIFVIIAGLPTLHLG